MKRWDTLILTKEEIEEISGPLFFDVTLSDVLQGPLWYFQGYIQAFPGIFILLRLEERNITVLSYITLSQMQKQHFINCSSKKYYQSSHESKMFYEVVWISQHQEKIHIMNLDHLLGMFFPIQSRRVRHCFSFSKISDRGFWNILWASQLVLVVKNLPTSAGVWIFPGLGRFPWWRAWQPTPVFLPGEWTWTEKKPCGTVFRVAKS